MCNSKADGGQRCYSHAKDRYDRAVRNLRLGTAEATEAFIAAEVEYASTPQGEADLAAQREAALAAGDTAVAEGLAAAITRGQALRERNAAIKGAVKGAEKARDERAILATLPPTDIDTRLAALDAEEHANDVAADRAIVSLHYAIGDQRTTSRHGRTWAKSYDQTVAEARAKATDPATPGYKKREIERTLDALDKTIAERARIAAATEPLNAEFVRRGGWNRAFLVDNVNGHVHRDRSCSTCEPTTRYSWQTQYSGMDEATIVEAAGEMCCTRCYPSAPAEVLNRPTQMVSASQAAAAAAREERATAKATRERAKIEKALTVDGSEFRVVTGPGRYDKESFKTEQSATNWVVDREVSHGPGGWLSRTPLNEQTVQAIREVKDAIGVKHGWTREQVEEHLAAKIKAKRKREGIT